MPIQERINHIVQTHHAFLRKELPELAALIEEACKGAVELVEWDNLKKAFLDMKTELLTHMLKEETMLFPSMLHIEKAIMLHQPPDLTRYDIRIPLERMEAEHNDAQEFLEQISESMKRIGRNHDNYKLIDRITLLKKDLEEHIRIEENDLFPEARLLFARATEGMQ